MTGVLPSKNIEKEIIKKLKLLLDHMQILIKYNFLKDYQKQDQAK